MFEHKKIETTNLDIIRKAISYTFPKDEEAKNLHIAFLSAYSLDILSRTFLIGEGGLQVNDDQINLDRDCAEYNMRDKKILLSINKLKDDSKYISDLIAIFHETYHYATSMGVIENGKKYASNKSILKNHTEDFANYISDILNGKGLYEGAIDKLNISEDDKAKIIDSIKEYLFSKYLSTPTEVGARKYSIEVVDGLLTVAKDLPNLTEYEIKMIETLTEGLKTEKSNEKVRNVKYGLIESKCDDIIIPIIRYARSIVMEKDDRGRCYLDDYKDFNAQQHSMNDKINGEVIDGLLWGLMLDYDEDCASKLFDTMVDVSDKNKQFRNLKLAKLLCEFTPFVPTKVQVGRLNANIESWKEIHLALYERLLPLDRLKMEDCEIEIV